MTRAAEPHASSDIFSGQRVHSEQEWRYAPFSHERVRSYTDRLSECALEMPRLSRALR